VKVIIKMDSQFVWYPMFPVRRMWKLEENTVDIPEEILDEYEKIAERFFDLQEYFEHAYRHQEGYKPYLNSPYFSSQK